MTVPVSEKRTALLAAARDRILVLDGAMGTMIQGLEYDEAAFRGGALRISIATSGATTTC
jgi:Methionine synthase I (cobalamin-dependent), methyltransferase domain